MKHENVKRTLASLDGLRRAPANPFLYQRIRLRMDVARAAQRVNLKLAWRLAAVCLLVAGLNILSWARLNRAGRAGGQDAVQQLYSEYFSSTRVYSY